ncbi:cobalt ECF transporter T component CbiQ [Desulfolithobacter sp.]
MTFEEFSQGDSLLHRIDTRVKLVCTLAVTLVIALGHSFATAAGGLVLGLVLLAMARLPLRQVLWRLVVVNSFIGLLWLSLPLTYPGDPLTMGPLHLSRQGLMLVGLITIKANGIVLLFITLLATSTVAKLGHGLRQLRIPAKLCLLLLFSYRYIFVISQEYQRLQRAAHLRCFKPGTNLHTYRTYGHLFGMTLVKSWNRAQRVTQAMTLRGFQGRFYILDDQTLKGRDLVFLATMSALVLCLGIVEGVR